MMSFQYTDGGWEIEDSELFLHVPWLNWIQAEVEIRNAIKSLEFMKT